MKGPFNVRLLFVFGLILGNSDAVADDDPRVSSLREHAIVVRSIDPKDDDFSDLEPLKELLSHVRIVQLGEQSHGDGATFHAKTRLIRFLHQEMGFDVLAFESGLYDCRKAWEQFQARADPHEAAQTGIFSIWTRSREVRPLFDYLAASAQSDRPLELCGFDCQLTGAASATTLASDFRGFVEGLADDPVCRKNGAAIAALIGDLSLFRSAPKPADQQRWLAAFASLRKSLSDPDIVAEQSADEVAFWAQWLKSTEAYARIAWSRSEDRSNQTLAEWFNPRDAQMADNMLWLARKRYPNRKIIVWAATMHIQRNADRIDTRRDDLNYTGIQPMGHHLWDALGDDVFTIGFTAYEGQVGVPWAQPRTLERAPTGSLEDLCVRAGLENAFLNFRGTGIPEFLRKPLISRPLGHSLMKADWTQVLDGMVFTRTMTPSTKPPDPKLQQLRARAAKQREAARDLVAQIQSDWKRARKRLEKGNAYADKVTFGSEYVRWKDVVRPSKEQITSMREEITRWYESQESHAGLTWRIHALFALMLADEGNLPQAHREFDAALDSYPKKVFRVPSKHSYFQHLINHKAMLLWDEKGMAAALAFATERLAKDPRYQYFFAHPWRRRLESENATGAWSTIRDGVLKAYEQREREFPNNAEAIRARAARLPMDAPERPMIGPRD